MSDKMKKGIRKAAFIVGGMVYGTWAGILLFCGM